MGGKRKKRLPKYFFIWQNWKAGLWIAKNLVWENTRKYYREVVSFMCNRRYWSFTLLFNAGSKSLILKRELRLSLDNMLPLERFPLPVKKVCCHNCIQTEYSVPLSSPIYKSTEVTLILALIFFKLHSSHFLWPRLIYRWVN